MNIQNGITISLRVYPGIRRKICRQDICGQFRDRLLGNTKANWEKGFVFWGRTWYYEKNTL